MTRAAILRRITLMTAMLLSSCSLHSKAVQWHGHVGSEGKPVFVQQSTYVGLRLAIFLPFVGHTDIGAMIDECSAWISQEEGSHLRLVETETNNYWYGVPPLSWLFTPVVASVTIEYQPSPAALAREGVAAVALLPAAPQR